jgi:O-antigen/teichoic acid export membrane protein
MIAFSASQGIFLAWSTPVVFTIIAVTWYLFKKRIPEHEALGAPSESLPQTRELIFLAGAQYATLLFSVFTPSIVSLIVIERLGAVANAHYYVPALISSGLILLNLSIERSFLVEAASEPYALRRHANVALTAMAVVLIPGVLIGVVFAPDLLRIFGQAYEAHGTALLRMLLLSIPLSTVSIFYSSFAWLDKRVWPMAARDCVTVVIYFAVVFSLIGRLGINAIGVGSLVSSGVLGIFFLPITIRRYGLTTNAPAPEITSQ